MISLLLYTLVFHQNQTLFVLAVVHILRHTFAKAMIAKDVNTVTVKELLGHANIQTTMIYTNPNQKEVQNAYLKAIK